MCVGCVIENRSLVEYKGNAENITIQDVITIDSFAFKGNTSLKSITISSDVHFIKERSFECCYGLEELIISSEDVVIGDYAFNNCPKLKSIKLAKGILEIPRACFFSCSSLNELSLPESIVRIGDGAFESCGIETLVVPSGVEEIGDYAFRRCWKLRSVKLPRSIKIIGRNAFSYCKYLPTDTIEIPEEANVADTAFIGCCKKGYRILKCVVECKDENQTIQEDLSIELKDDDTIEDVALNEVISIIREEYEDIIVQAMDASIVLDIDGRCNLQDISNRLYPGAKEYIARNILGVYVHLKEYEDDEVVTDVSIPLAEVLDQIIDESMECESWDCDLGGIIEDSLLRFEQEGSWHFGLMADNQVISDVKLWPSPSRECGNLIWEIDEVVYKPIIWFGNSDTPVVPWVLFKDMSSEIQEFWMETDEDQFMQAVIEDCNDMFLVWYFAECGRCIPDMDDIKKRCPIDLNPDIESDAFWNRFNEFFLTEYRVAQS